MFKGIFLSAILIYFLSEVQAAPKGKGKNENLSCPTLQLKLGRVRYRQKGRFVKFTCNTGYIIAGEKYSICHNGEWDSPVPKCVRASCVKANPPIHGLIYPSHRGAVLNFFCKPGYELHGPNATYCDGRTWDNSLPACIPSNTKPPLSCDFETEDLCGWNQDIRHDFDWTRMNFKTPSGHLGTGPSFDHTKGEGRDGYYMYIESSSRNENDTSRLISPIYEEMDQLDVCLEFYYHMHGASTGQLRVYLKKISESWDLDPKTAIFWRTGNHGDTWLKSLHQIGPIDEDFQIVIEGVRGASYFSDIAVDDVRILQNCAPEDDITTESDVTYTDDDRFESCINRCDIDNYVIPPEDMSLNKCGCDETCVDNNTCCPDYIAVCILGVTDDMTATDTYYTTPEPTTIMQTETTSTTSTTINNSLRPIFTTPIQKHPKENETESNNIDTNVINSTLPKIPNTTNTVSSPPKMNIPVSVTNSTSTSKAVVSIKTLPTLVFLSPTTPQVIVQKTKTTLIRTIPSTSKTTKSTVLTLSEKTTSAVTQQPPFRISTTPGLIDDVATVPEVHDDDKTYFPFVNAITSAHHSSPSPIRQFPNDIKVFSSSSKSTQKMVKESGTSTNLIIILVVVSISFILISIVSGIFYVKRYKRYGCRNRRHMNGSSSDSQSDVRFLTSDEILDFNLSYPDD